MEETNAKLGSVTTGDSDGLLVLTVGGRWNIGGAEKLESSLGAVTPRPGQSVRLDRVRVSYGSCSCSAHGFVQAASARA